ncbi:hypothetical protein D6C84_00725 [Aureobasidium pullulans]|uniref:Uncharacterized protein n=1 Tax=Aureobasidium pullulans TaxID=5580 RepID=A0A4S9YAQ4_AURPU|nr:hypothetical protein D6C84_00725 [Aureobasidium pullulans]
MAQYRHHITQDMRDMAKSYHEWGISGLSEDIEELDKIYAPKSSESGLSTPAMKEHACLMLAQIAPDMMESLLDNTLVEKWKAGIITLNDWNRIPRAVHEDREPAIYVNYYTKPDGSGLSTGEYKDYLLAIEAALTAKNVTINGKSFDMVKEIDHYYKVRTGSKTLFSKSPGWASCRTSLPDFLVYQNKLISVAARDGKVEIRFHGEVGWAIDTDSRIKAHHNLQGSAFWFRLTMCVVSVLWPQHNFELSSFCMFRVMMWNHAEIGESIGSHLVNSYPGYGGFNFTTAGLATSSAVEPSSRLWMTVSKQYEECLTYAQKAIEAHEKDMQQKNDELKAQRENILLSNQAATLHEDVEKQLVAAVEEDRNHAIELNHASKQLKGLRKVFQSKEAETKRYYDALRGLARDFQFIRINPVPEPRFRDVYQSSEVQGSLHEIKKASKEKDKQIASLKLQLRNSRNNVEHQIKDHREATQAHFQAVQDDLDDEIENLMAENELLSRLLEDKREDFNDKHEKLLLVSRAHARCVGKRYQLVQACDIQEETISRQSNQLMQRRLECEAKDRKILQLTAEIEELVRKGAEPMEEARANMRKFEDEC